MAEMEIKNPKHAESCIAKLQCLFEKEVLCDLTLKVGNSLFKVHKFLLVSQSKYFENMLLEERYVEAKEDLVELEEVDPGYFQKILRYFYYGSIVVSMKDIEGILKLADYFLVHKLKLCCTKYLQKKMDQQNCILGFVSADKYKLKDEYRCQALDFISTNIEEVSKTDDFCNLSQDKLVKILNYNANNACSEGLFNAIFSWITHDKDNRKDLILDLVQLVSTRGLKQSFIMDNLLSEPLIRENSDCSNWLFDQIHERFATKNIVCNEKCNALFFTHAVQNSSCSINISAEKVTKLTAKPKDIIGFCVCSHKDNVFLLGGDYEGQAYNKSMKINSGKLEWEELNWDFGRRDAGACVLWNEIYIAGGYNSAQQTASSSFHVCDMATGKQIRLRDMVHKRRYPALCTYEGSLYACCGNNGVNNLYTIERYDPREGDWEIYATLPYLSGVCAAVVRDDKMFIYKTEMDRKNYYLCRGKLLDFKNKSWETREWKSLLWGCDSFSVPAIYVLNERTWNCSVNINGTAHPYDYHVIPWETYDFT